MSRIHRFGRITGPVLVVLVAAVAAYQRIAYFALGRGLWRDEAALMQSIATFDFDRLTGPLLDQQSAPLLFLWAIKAVMVVGGDSERWLRVLPLAAGLACLPLTVAATRMVVTRRADERSRRSTGTHAGPISWFGACLPIGATAFSAQIVFYCAQVKPYTLDMATVTGLLVLAQLLARRGVFDPAARRWRAGFVLVALVAPWLSAGAMLCVGPIACWVVVVALRRNRAGLRAWRAHRVWWAGLLVAGIGDVFCAVRAARLAGAVPALTDYWSDWLSPLSQGQGLALGQAWHWHAFLLADFLRQDVGSSRPYLLALVLLAGWLCVLRRDVAGAVLLALPAATGYAAAVAGEYPFARRLVLFVLPGLLVGLGALFDDTVHGLARLAGWLRGRLRRRARLAPRPVSALRLGVCGLVVAAAAVAAVPALAAGPRSLRIGLDYAFGVDDYKPALEFVAAKRDPTDVLVVGVPDRVVVRYYARRLGIPPDSIAVAALPRYLSTAPTSTQCPLPARMRRAHSIWIVSSDVLKVGGTYRRVWLRQPLQATHYVAYAAVLRYVSVLRMLPADQGADIPTPCPVYRTLGPAGADPAAQPRFG